MIRAFTRVAVVQLAFHPAMLVQRRSPLSDPLFDIGRPDSLLPEIGDVPATLRPRLDALRRRIREVYGAQLLDRIRAILAQLRALDVRVAVFPEHSIPWEILGGVADAAGEMLVVAGTHTVERAGLLSGIYERLGGPRPPESRPEIGREVCPIFHRGRLLSLQSALGRIKNHAAHGATTPPLVVYSPSPWLPTPTPEGVPGPMGALPYFDFIYRDAHPFKEALDEPLKSCRFLAVPSVLMSADTGRTWEEAKRFGRPVLHAAWARSGATSIYVDEPRGSDLRFFPDHAGHLERGDEGAVIADVDLSYERASQSNRDSSARAILPVAEATLVYRAHPVADSYAQWLEETAQLLSKGSGDAAMAATSRADAARDLLLNAGALSGAKARDRRLRRMLDELNNLTDVEEIRQFTREIVLPPSVLPMMALSAALARGAADEIFAWLTRADARAAGFGEVEARLRAESERMVSEASSWTRAGAEAFAAVREAVRGAPDATFGPPPSEARPSVLDSRLHVVLPAGLDPAALGVKRGGGFLFDFRSTPDEFRVEISQSRDENDANRLEAHRPNPEAKRDSAAPSDSGEIRAPDGEFVGLDFSEVHLWVAQELYLLAIAEGAERVAVAGVRPSGAAERDEQLLLGEALLVLSRAPGGDDWIAREAGRSPWLTWKWPLVKAAFAEAGLGEVELETLATDKYLRRITDLLPRFEGARAAVEAILSLRLREVSWHFVAPDVIVDAGKSREPFGDALDSWLNSDDQTALILGEFGAGKSTALAEWANRRWAFDTGPRPILVSLAAASRGRDAEGLLLEAARAADTRENRAALRLLIARRLIIPCFDGFDEMATRLDAADLAGRLSSLIGVARGGGKVVVTSRDNYFPMEEEIPTVTEIALRQALGSSAGVRKLALQPFNEAQVRSLVEMVRGEGEPAAESLAKIAQIYDLRELVSRPLLLGMVLATLDQIEPGSKVGTADLYEAYLTRWLAQTRSGDPQCFTDEQKIEFAESLAEQLWRSGRATCSWSELQGSVRARLAQYLPHEAPPRAALLEIQGGAFFVREEDDRFRFAHKSFLEYFLARGVVFSAQERPQEVLTTRPITPEVASFVGEILRRHGNPKDMPAIRRIRAWLAGEMVEAWAADMPNAAEAPKEGAPTTAVPAANAARLLLGLGRWAKDPRGWIPEGADLRGAKLSGEDLRGAALVRANLGGAKLSGADLRGADLTGAKLSGAKLSGAKLSHATLREATAQRADFIQAEAHQADLSRADLTGALLRQSMWTSCDFDDVVAVGADLTGWSAPGSTGALPEQLSCAVRARSHAATLATGRSHRVYAVAWSPDGVRLAIGGKSGMVRIWDTQTGHDVAHLYGHSRSVNSIAWHPDGVRVATASNDGTLRFWSSATGEEIAQIAAGASLAYVAFRPDGERLIGAGRGGASIYDASTHKVIAAHRADGDGLYSAAWSPDGSRVALAGEDGLIRILDGEGAQEIARFQAEREISALRFSPDGSHLAMMTLLGAVALRPLEGAEIAHLDLKSKLKSKANFALDFHPGGDWIACGSLQGVHIWNVKTGREIGPIELPEVTSVAWSRDGAQLAIGTSASGVRIWDFEARKEALRAAEPTGSFESVEWSSDGATLATAGSDGSARLWTAGAGQEVAAALHEKGPRMVALSADHGLFAAAIGNAVKVITIADGHEVQSLELPGRSISAIAWHPTEACLAMTGAGGTMLFDVGRRTLRQISEVGAVVAWDPKGALLAIGVAGWRGPITIVNARTDKVIRRLTTSMASITAIAWSPTEEALASAGESGVEIWSLGSEERAAVIEGLTRPVSSMAFRPDGLALATAAGDETIRLWDAKTGARTGEIRHPDDPALAAVAFRRDGQQIAAAGYLGLHIWDAEGSRLLCTLEAIQKNTLARTPGGFCVFGGGDPERYRLALRRPGAGSSTRLYLPICGVREALQRPDKVAAALAGDLSGDDLDEEIERLGLDNGTPWDGKARIVPDRPSKSAASKGAPIKRGAPSLPKPSPPMDASPAPASTPAPASASASAPVSAPVSAPGSAPMRAPGAAPPPASARGAALPPEIMDAPISTRPPVSSRVPGAATRFTPRSALEKDGPRRSLPPLWATQQAQTQNQIQIQNPFRPGPALTDAETLPGRELVINDLLALIDSRSPAVLRGPRRAGKTSILHSIEKRLLAQQRPVFRLTLEATRVVDPDDLARVIDPALKNDLTPSDTLRIRLREGRRTTILLDEVANLKAADPSVFAWLRAVGQEEASIVFAGSFWDWVLVVERASSAPGSSFGNDVTPVSLGPIPTPDAVEFLVGSAPPDVPLEEERTARWILELCGTWPFYLQVMGHAVVQAVRAGNRAALVERKGVSELYEQKLLVDRDAVFRGRWAELPDRARRILRPPVSPSATINQAARLPAYNDLPRDDRKVLRDTGLCSPLGAWLDDPPFFDWIRRSADDHEGGLDSGNDVPR